MAYGKRINHKNHISLIIRNFYKGFFQALTHVSLHIIFVTLSSDPPGFAHAKYGATLADLPNEFEFEC